MELVDGAIQCKASDEKENAHTSSIIKDLPHSGKSVMAVFSSSVTMWESYYQRFRKGLSLELQETLDTAIKNENGPGPQECDTNGRLSYQAPSLPTPPALEIMQLTVTTNSEVGNYS